MDNLRLWNIKERQLTNIYEPLVENNFIETIVTRNNRKYVYINNQLLSLWIGTKNNSKQLSDKIIDLGKEIGVYFSKTDEHQLKEVYTYLTDIKDLDYFEYQFNNYKNYKDYTNEKIHSFKKYCLEWNEYNWENKLNREKINELKKEYENY